MGINSTAEFYFNMGYAVPAYECFTAPVPVPFPPFYLPAPVCYTRTQTGNTSTRVEAIKFDIFPRTVGEFMALGPKENGGRGQAWDERFPVLFDADGDGLTGSSHKGMDPNDTTWDADGDRLADRFELERRQAGSALSPLAWDTDGDGLTDRQELAIGTNPALADTDNDGLRDGEEIRHQVYTFNSATGKVLPTGAWQGGWEVTVQGPNALTVRVSSDPLSGDSDGDGVSDQAERELALDPNPANRLDDQNRPYHPNLPNTPPIALYTAINDVDGFVQPGQRLLYTTTAVASVALAPGVLDVIVPPALGGSPAPYQLTFSGAQTVTQQTALAVQPGAGSGEVRIESQARTRLPERAGPAYTWSHLAQTPLTGFGHTPHFVDAAAGRVDRPDSYLLTAQSATNNSVPTLLFGGPGDLTIFALPGGQSRDLAPDTDTNSFRDTAGNQRPPQPDQAFFRVNRPPGMACNDAGQCLAVWNQLDNCNAVNINLLRVIRAGGDHGTSGIEPVIFFAQDGNDTNPTDGGYEVLWRPGLIGVGNDVRSGTTFGPNRDGFPLRRTFCNNAAIGLYETDGISSNQPVDWSLQDRIDNLLILNPRNVPPVTRFESNGHIIEVEMSSPAHQFVEVAGALVNADGAVVRSQFQLSADNNTEFAYNPAVASDGTNFLVVWERFSLTVNGGTTLVWRLYDGNGQPRSAELTAPTTTLRCCTFPDGFFSPPTSNLQVDWIENRYRITRQGLSDLDQRNRITAYDISPTGQALSSLLITSEAAADPALGVSHDMAYDPVTDRTLIVYANTNDAIEVRAYQPNNTLFRRVVLPDLPLVDRSRGRPVPTIAYQPVSQTYLVTVLYPRSNGRDELAYYLLEPDLSLRPERPRLTVAQNQFLNPAGSALACPAAASAPLVDLPFEELPGVTTFADRSGYSHNAGCIDGNCPAPGAPGAPSAERSDHALRFDGVDDALTVNTAAVVDYAIALWVRTDSAGARNAVLVDGGGGTAAGFVLDLLNGTPRLLVGQNTLVTANRRIDDGAWHFVVATRENDSGRIRLYVDGAEVANALRPTGVVIPLRNLRIGTAHNGGRSFGGEIDHLQFFSTALGADTVRALFDRTLRQSCLFAAPGNNSVSHVQIAEERQDNRGGRIVVDTELALTIDGEAPTVTLDSLRDGAVVQGNGAGTTLIIGGTATDNNGGAGVALVEVRVNEAAWQPAVGNETWSYPLVVTEGPYTVTVRATDAVGNVGPEARITLVADGSPPAVTLADLPATPIAPARVGDAYVIALTGAVPDDGGMEGGAVAVRLLGPNRDEAHDWQPATRTADRWQINYTLPALVDEPSGRYTVQVRAVDSVGNRTPTDTITGTLRLDVDGPEAALSADDLTRAVIDAPLILTGVITDPGAAGVATLDLRFTPLTAVAAFEEGVQAEVASAQIEEGVRITVPATLTVQGAISTTWQAQVPRGLEGQYQIDLHATDLRNNTLETPYAWRGTIDTLAPRVVLTATPTGASYVDAQGARRYAITYHCAAVDRHLADAGFVCPGEALPTPVRSFDDTAIFQEIFPDLTIRNGLTLSYTQWETTPQPLGAARACDLFDNCTEVTVGDGAAGREAAEARSLVTPSGPQAVIIAPTIGNYLAADGAVEVTIAAEAATPLREVTLMLDGTVVETLTFSAAEAVDRRLRTVTVPITAEGEYTLDLRAIAEDGSVQTSSVPLRFTVDRTPPTITIDPAPLTTADTWALESDVLRFRGTVSDTMGLAAVQIQVNDGPYMDATFDHDTTAASSTWRAALYLPDPEGEVLDVRVRAIDRAGRIAETSATLNVDFAAPNPPETTLLQAPADPTTVLTATFAFTGTTVANEIAAFTCGVDDGPFLPCASPYTVTVTSYGRHVFAVRALDDQGHSDPTSATHTWTVAEPRLPKTGGSGDGVLPRLLMVLLLVFGGFFCAAWVSRRRLLAQAETG